jgi:hypothetical protein
MRDKIKKQTKQLATQLEKLDEIPEDDDEQYIKELEKYHPMVKASKPIPPGYKKRKLTLADRVLAPKINKIRQKVDQVNEKLIEHNEMVKHENQ